MKTIEINIPDMQSAHCQSRVNNVAKEIPGVHLQQIQAGKLFAEVDSDQAQSELLSAIKEAGYNTDSAENDGESSCSTGCCG